jgi:hypothetical protein
VSVIQSCNVIMWRATEATHYTKVGI